ncbi:MAG: hypothetical protein PHS17_14655, partial [Desulfobacterales bacterium]|nr:hypothetical protein [Desulfobacterales bacterium]
MVETSAIPPSPDPVKITVDRIIAGVTEQVSPEAQKNMLSNLLDRVESKLLHLRNRLLSVASHVPDSDVQALIGDMRADEEFITSYCIHCCDREDPQASINHDLINNDYSLNLQQRLAAARNFGIAYRR